MSKMIKTIMPVLLILFSVNVFAEIKQEGDEWRVYDEQYSEEIEFEYRDVLIEHQKWGTGDWLPGCGGLMPLSVKFNVEYGAEMGAKMKGRAHAKWPEAVKVYFEGTPNGGEADMFYGINMEALWKNCYSGQEQELSKWLNFDLSFQDYKIYEPFLLDGNVDNPVSMEDSIDHFLIYEGTLADMVGGSCGLSIPFIGDICSLIHFKFELDGKMYVEIFGSRIALDEKQGRSIFSDDQYLVIEPPLVGTIMEIPVHYESKVYYETIIIFTITIRIRILELEFPIPIEIPIADGDKIWTYNSQTVYFNFPAIFIDRRSHKFADTVPGDEDYWEFEVENIGSRPLEGKIISDNSNFIVMPDTVNLDPGGSTTVTVFFKPYDVGTKKGTIKFYSNDPVEPYTTVSLFGYSSESDTQWTKVIEGDEPRWEVVSKGNGCSVSVIGGEQ
ncbi:MAG TPA: hypothetical protein PLD55_10295 [bacterium]|nr:hypothetical protein [bacterium]MDX9805934.1 hypothetical protein [bacterium]HPM47437.1 hypothetical protein [bacterium]HPY15109.1 hypothetical protein [bacterium]HQM85057.1 hypothetical protein [bacterium]